MTVVEKLLSKVDNGATFSVDFKQRNLKVNGRYLVKEGKYKGEYGFLPCKALEHVEELYHAYRYSYPSEDGVKYRSYFTPLTAEELSVKDMVLGKDREVARAELESYILGLMLSGFSWDDQDELKGKWFWRSSKEPSLRLLKEWFTGEEFTAEPRQ